MDIFEWFVTSYFGGVLIISYAIWRIWRLLKKTENPEHKDYYDARAWFISYCTLVLGITIIVAKLIGKL